MINLDNNNPWYPYFVNELVGANLDVGDNIVQSTCSSNELRSLSWMHNGSLKILIISRSTQTYDIMLNGVSGQASISLIDNTISWETPSVQTGTISLPNQIHINGYSVMLIEL